MSRTPPPWPLLHVSELAYCCEACCTVVGARVRTDGSRLCTLCWQAAVAGAS